MKRISGLLAIAATTLVLSSGSTATALEPQAPKTSRTDKSALLQQRAQAIRCTVPDLIGLNVSAARSALETAHLSIGDQARRPDSHSTGTIIGQSAKPGTPITCGLAVDIVTAVFREPQRPDPSVCQVRVPDLGKADVASAERILRDQKLRLGDVETEADTRTKGSVIGQSPARGTPVRCGSAVSIVVAVPPEPPPCPPITIPSVIGRDVDNGIKLLARAGLRVRNIDKEESKAPAGTILRHSAPTPLGKCDASIDLVVAVPIRVLPPPPPPDPPMCTVPKLYGADQQVIEKLLDRAGLALGKTSAREDRRPVGTVIQQWPEAGTLLRCSSPVEVVFAQTPAPVCPPITVPSVIGRDQDTGIRLLARAGLRVRNIDKEESKAPAGTILRHSAPRPLGKCDASIDLVVAVPIRVLPPPPPPDPPMCTVPKLYGADQQVIEKLLDKAGLALGRTSVREDRRPVGTVIQQWPEAGTPLRCSSPVEVVFAQTPAPVCPPITVPSVIGRDQDTGIKLLARAGLRAGNIAKEESEEPTGTILRVSAPKALEKCEASIDLVVSLQKRVAPPPPPPPPALPPPPPPVVVPQLTGHLQADALDLLRSANLSAGTIRERQSSQTAGTVVEQRPAAGTPVSRGTVVDVVVAIPVPVKLITVPQLIGQRPENMGALLGNSLRIGSIATRQSSAAAGVIVDQTPAAGQSVAPGSPVNVWIATPATPVQITVPDLRGRSQNEAAAAIQGVKLLVGPVAERESTESRGTVVEQIPPPGTLVDVGTPISLWLAVPIAPVVPPVPPQPPPVLIVVPRVVEGSLAEALVAIRAAGLQPGTITQTPSAIAAGIVTFQTPAAGIQVTAGTPVDLIASVPLAEAEVSELPLIWLSGGLFAGLLAAAAAGSLSRARRHRLAGAPTLVPHADEGTQTTSVPADGDLVDSEVTLDAHADPGAQMLEEKPGLIAGEWSGTQVMSW